MDPSAQRGRVAPLGTQGAHRHRSAGLEQAREAFLAGRVGRAMRLYGRLGSDAAARNDLRAMLALLDRIEGVDGELERLRERARRRVLSLILA